MTAWGFIATLLALVLAVMAVRLSRRRVPSPPAPRRSKPPRSGPHPSRASAPSAAGNDASRADMPPSSGPVPRGDGKVATDKGLPRQPLADAIFKIYTGEDMEERAREDSGRGPSGPPPPALRGSDWA